MVTASLIVSLLAALSAAYLAYSSGYVQLRQKKQIREIAIKSLNIFMSYIDKKDVALFSDANKEFNKVLSNVEKRMILVCLSKIGIPVLPPLYSELNFDNIEFENIKIIKNDISSMILSIKNGNCDQLFFLDAENYLSEGVKINAMREIAKKIVEKAIRGSKMSEDGCIIFKNSAWKKEFNIIELNITEVFYEKNRDVYYYNSNMDVDDEKIDRLIKDIDLGLWDGYLRIDFEYYKNIKIQNDLFGKFASVDINTFIPPSR